MSVQSVSGHLKRHGMRTSRGDRIFYIVNGTLLAILTLIVLLPLINIVVCSFSDPNEVARGAVILLPKKITFRGYQAVFDYPGIWTAYGNTVFYAVVGTTVNLAMTLSIAYALSRPGVPFRGLITGLFTFTMMFGGGMIPNYILMRDLHILNTRWAMIIPGAISVYNMMLARTFIQNIPTDLWEAAEIDGCSEFRFFFMMVLPLSVTLISVLALYYAVGHWNSYFDAFLYLNDSELMPLQLKLRAILVANTVDEAFLGDEESREIRQNLADLLKYSMIIVSSVPVLVLYPFVKKYFVKGVMLGSLKG